MTQPELFEIRQVGNLTLFEPKSRLASGQQTHPANNFSGPPMPAPANSLPPFARNSETSRQAAIKKYDHHTSHSQREMICRLIRFSDEKGITREEIAEKLGLSGDTVRPRVWELLGNNGFTQRIKESGVKRKTKSGNNAGILVAICNSKDET